MAPMTDEQILGALAESEWKRESDIALPHLARREITRRLENIRVDVDQNRAIEILNQVVSVKNDAFLSSGEGVGYVDDPKMDGEVVPGRWRLVSNRKGRLKTDPQAQGIYQTLRKGYHQSINWTPAPGEPLLITDGTLTEPARYSPDADSFVVKIVNLDPSALQPLAVGIPAQITDPVFVGQTWTGNWLKSTVDAYQDMEDGSGIILVRFSKGGREIPAMEIASSCLHRTTFAYYWDYTKAELDQLVSSWQSITPKPGQVIEDPIIRYDTQRKQYDVTFIIRHYEGVDGTIEGGGRKLHWGQYAKELPDLGDRRFLGGSVNKDQSCRFNYSLNTEDATAREEKIDDGGRRIRAKTNQPKDKEIEVSEGYRLTGGNIRIHPDGKKDVSLTEENAEKRKVVIKDEDREAVTETNQDEDPEIPENRRITHSRAEIMPDGKHGRHIIHEDATARSVQVEDDTGKGRKILAKTNQTPEANNKVTLPAGLRLRGGSARIHPGGKVDLQAQVQDTNNPHELTREYGTVGRKVTETAVSGANVGNVPDPKQGGKGVTNQIRISLGEDGVANLKSIKEETARVGRSGFVTGTALHPRDEKSFRHADDPDMPIGADKDPGTGITRSIQLVPAEDDKFELRVVDQRDVPHELDEFISQREGLLRILTTKKRNQAEPLTLDANQYGTCDNVVRDTKTIDAIKRVMELDLPAGFKGIIVNLKATRNEIDERFTTFSLNPSKTESKTEDGQRVTTQTQFTFMYEFKRVYERAITFSQEIELSLAPLNAVEDDAPDHGERRSRVYQLSQNIWARETLTVTINPWVRTSKTVPELLHSKSQKSVSVVED